MNNKRFPMPIPFGWFHVAYSDELEVGQSKPIHYFGHEMVLFRDESGQAQVLDAYCPHMGAHLGYGINAEAGQGGKVVGGSIVCPFHAWKISGEGKVEEIPYAKNIPPKVKDKQCLKSWPVAEKNKAIFVWYHPEDKEPLFDIVENEDLKTDDWGDLQKFRWIVKTHMQEIGENGADPAHFRYVHQTATFPDTDITFDGYRRYATFKAKLDTPRGQINGCIDSVSNGPGQGQVRYTGICETIQLGHVTPIDQETCEVNFAFSQKKVNGKVPEGGVNAAIVADICKQLEEDKPIWETKIYRQLPILCDGDGPIHKFSQWMQQFYVEDVDL